MASPGTYYSLMIMMIAAIGISSSSVSADEIEVGDDQGWKLGFDYQNWAQGKKFYVGDTLVFKYTPGSHSVLAVNGTVFKDCTIPPANEALTTGNDTIILKTSGNKWYICVVGKHCEGGQKLAITTLDQNPSSVGAKGTTIFQLAFAMIIVTILTINLVN